MKTIGIVAEYNPFHTGHAWHIRETRRLVGEDAAVAVVMSGNWVQRGECALTDKWTRAELALRGGADLVLELPLVWAVSSAEAVAQTVGSSSTRSAPPCKAVMVRVHLSVTAHSPRWTQLPLMTAMTAASSPTRRRVSRMCQACPV